MGVKQDAVLQVGHDLVEVLLQGGEDLFHVAHTTSDAFDFVRHQHHGIIARSAGRRLAGSFRLRQRQGIEASPDLFNRFQRKVGKERSKNQRARIAIPV